ncbi:class I SAM-dependent methyltransferase [Actinomadura flavalba]|uniref:class I SAM-dependent methyltransferase n=1 Tax=Actinomadura flavalba TaxID=1120938 RepID=UPI00037E74AD|nr:class I SAM-dependent methyltransferase [Actinomadura flavalba]
MGRPATSTREAGSALAPHLRRLLAFTEPGAGDVCLDVAAGPGPLPGALAPYVRQVVSVDAADAPPGGRTATVEFPTGPVRIKDGTVPTVPPRPAVGAPDPVAVHADATDLPYEDGAFSLVTARFALFALGDPARVLRELLRVCRRDGRLVLAELIRGDLGETARGGLAGHRAGVRSGVPSLAALTDLIAAAGGDVRRLDAFTVERPAEPWLASLDEPTADTLRLALIAEVDGGPRTGARPRVIGGELWFTQSWVHVSARPA